MRHAKKIGAMVLVVSVAVSMIGILPQQVIAGPESFNYGEALQKSIMFYEFQKSGDLAENQRNNWRGDSGMQDGQDVGLDLTGGWYDAGDHVKFNLPMAYTSTMLAWSVIEDKDAYIESGQYDYMLDEIRWANDYFIKCHPSPNVYYFQLGDGGLDHSFWGSAEIMQMNRPAHKLDLSKPGSAVSAETAASLAASAIVFKDSDPSYAATCLKHAKELYQFAETTKSDTAYDAVASAFYKSWSGFYDELSWAGTWIYLADGDKTYLDKAESYVGNWGKEGQSSDIAYKWAHNWDDVHQGAALLLARITNKSIYKIATENHLDYWTTGVNGSKVKYTPKGLAWLDSWGSLRYATTTAFLASVYAEWEGCAVGKVNNYQDFAKKQANYVLGSTGRSFQIGFGENYPQRPHHRTAHGSWTNNLSAEPSQHRHVLVGALVGGPDSSDGYTDRVDDYVSNEVACDYNAGFTGLLAKMYKMYGGSPVQNLTAIEEVGEELFIEAGINAQDKNNVRDFIEIKAVVYNRTAWPARVTDQLSFNYFIDLTDVIKAGYKASDMQVSTAYSQAGAKASQVLPWDVANNIYYVNVDLKGAKIYPGGQSEHKSEIQFRIMAPAKWDYTKSFSFTDLTGTTSNGLVKANHIPLYDKSILVFGKEPGEVVSIYSPTVAITEPETGTVFEDTSSIQIKAEAAVQESTISKVEFYEGENKVGESLSMPYTVSFMPKAATGNASGIESYVITAKATAANGKETVSAPIKISVKTPIIVVPVPTVIITSPEAGTVFEKAAEKIQVRANVSISEGNISKVVFYANGIQFAESTGALDNVYEADYLITETAAEEGVLKTVSFTVEAISDNNQAGESEAVAVQIQPKVIEEPDVDFELSAEAISNPQLSCNTLTNNFKIIHKNGDDIKLSDLVVRYYYTNEDNLAQSFWCDNAAASINKAPWYVAYTNDVKGKIVNMEAPKEMADCYIEINFDTSDLLTQGTNLIVDTRVAKTNWSNYNQANDYSYQNNDRITIYYQGELVFGAEPQ